MSHIGQESRARSKGSGAKRVGEGSIDANQGGIVPSKAHAPNRTRGILGIGHYGKTAADARAIEIHDSVGAAAEIRYEIASSRSDQTETHDSADLCESASRQQGEQDWKKKRQ